jgi:uncharacterized protein (TIGR00304 family)
VSGLVYFGILLVLLGFGAVVLSIAASARNEEAKVRGAGVVMVGPIPIIFGSDAKWASIAVALAIVLVVVGLLSYLV